MIPQSGIWFSSFYLISFINYTVLIRKVDTIIWCTTHRCEENYFWEKVRKL